MRLSASDEKANKEERMKIYYDKDGDLKHIKGRKLDVIGYGSQ